jgi:hypothetical protein
MPTSRMSSDALESQPIGGPISQARRRRLSFRQLTICAVVLLGLSLSPASTGSASSGKSSGVKLIVGSVSECGGGPLNAIPRSMVITLRSVPNKRIVAVYIVRPSTVQTYYSFAVHPGIYSILTNQNNSPGPKHNVVIRGSSKTSTQVPIATVCQ